MASPESRRIRATFVNTPPPSDTPIKAQRQAAGVPVQLAIWDSMWHVWHAWADELPESRAAITQIGEFVRQHHL